MRVSALQNKALIIIECAQDSTVSDLKCRLSELERIPVLEQRLTYGGKSLDDDTFVNELPNVEDSIIYCSLRIRGGMRVSTTAPRFVEFNCMSGNEASRSFRVDSNVLDSFQDLMSFLSSQYGNYNIQHLELKFLNGQKVLTPVLSDDALQRAIQQMKSLNAIQFHITVKGS